MLAALCTVGLGVIAGRGGRCARVVFCECVCERVCVLGAAYDLACLLDSCNAASQPCVPRSRVCRLPSPTCLPYRSASQARWLPLCMCVTADGLLPGCCMCYIGTFYRCGLCCCHVRRLLGVSGREGVRRLTLGAAAAGWQGLASNTRGGASSVAATRSDFAVTQTPMSLLHDWQAVRTRATASCVLCRTMLGLLETVMCTPRTRTYILCVATATGDAASRQRRLTPRVHQNTGGRDGQIHGARPTGTVAVSAAAGGCAGIKDCLA